MQKNFYVEFQKTGFKQKIPFIWKLKGKESKVYK